MSEAKYASHLPVLKLLYQIKPYDHVLEFGSGMFSTKYFVSICRSIVSLENEKVEWFNKMTEEIGTFHTHFNYKFLPYQESVDWFNSITDKFDFIFVDGGIREQCLNASFGRASTIAIHDRGCRSWRTGAFNTVEGKEYTAFVVGLAMPNTTVFSIDPYIINALSGNANCVRIKR